MQDLVGIVRIETELQQATEELQKLRERTKNIKVIGNREYNAGWHTSLDMENLLTVSEAITLAAITRKESRGAHYRDDFPNKDVESGKFNLVIRKGEDGQMEIKQEAIKEIRPDLKLIIEEMK